MITRRTELNPAFKIAQPLPRLSGEPAPARGCSLPFFGPRLGYRPGQSLDLPIAAMVHRQSNENGQLRP
jgi:hypothetical protein